MSFYFSPCFDQSTAVTCKINSDNSTATAFNHDVSVLLILTSMHLLCSHRSISVQQKRLHHMALLFNMHDRCRMSESLGAHMHHHLVLSELLPIPIGIMDHVKALIWIERSHLAIVQLSLSTGRIDKHLLYLCSFSKELQISTSIAPF